MRLLATSLRRMKDCAGGMPAPEYVWPAQDMVKSLSEEMDEDMIPVAYGGQNTLPLYESKQETELRELVRRLNNRDPSNTAGTMHKLEQLNGATEAET